MNKVMTLDPSKSFYFEVLPRLILIFQGEELITSLNYIADHDDGKFKHTETVLAFIVYKNLKLRNLEILFDATYAPSVNNFSAISADSKKVMLPIIQNKSPIEGQFIEFEIEENLDPSDSSIISLGYLREDKSMKVKFRGRIDNKHLYGD